MIGIIGAMDIEVDGLKHIMTDKTEEKISGITFTRGRIGGKECVVTKCGIGKVNAAVAAQTMILRYSPEKLINTGIGGSTSLDTHIGSVVIAKDVIQHDVDTTIIGDKPCELFLPEGSIIYIPCDTELINELRAACDSLGAESMIGTVATGDQFISGNDKRLSLHERLGAIACEMEGGSIGQVCYLNNVPFAVLRSISDSMSDEDDSVEYSVFRRSSAENSINILITFLSADKD